MKIEIDVDESWLEELHNIFVKKTIAKKCGMAEYDKADGIIAKVIDAINKELKSKPKKKRLTGSKNKR